MQVTSKPGLTFAALGFRKGEQGKIASVDQLVADAAEAAKDVSRNGVANLVEAGRKADSAVRAFCCDPTTIKSDRAKVVKRIVDRADGNAQASLVNNAMQAFALDAAHSISELPLYVARQLFCLAKRDKDSLAFTINPKAGEIVQFAAESISATNKVDSKVLRARLVACGAKKEPSPKAEPSPLTKATDFVVSTIRDVFQGDEGMEEAEAVLQTMVGGVFGILTDAASNPEAPEEIQAKAADLLESLQNSIVETVETAAA